MGIVEICLAKDPEKQEGWMQALQVLLNVDSTPQERRRVLEENQVKLTDKEDAEIMKMFSYSDYIEEQVRAKTLAEAAVAAAAEKQKTVADIAVKLLSRGLSAEGVHEVTGLSISVINNLRGQMNRTEPLSGMILSAS